MNTGSQLYDAAFKKPIDQLKISDETREIVRRAMFVTALPFVKQVIVETGDDGVVKYESAHMDGVKSELVVRWEHSVQGQPEAILEVRRILLEHATAK